MELNAITSAVIDAAVNAHKELGPGLLESAYESCLAYELVFRKVLVQRQVPVPVRYRGEFWTLATAWTCSSRTG